MSEKKKHYYPECTHIAESIQNQAVNSGSFLRISLNGLLILGHLADRLADLVLAVEENTAASMYPDPNE